MANQPDMTNRDPNNINNHLKSSFEDVFAEPDGTHSIDCVWSLAYKCFSGCQGFWYKLITLFCGCFIACDWGIVFAFEVFRQVWYDTPCLRLLAIQCSPFQKCWTICLQCCLAPLCDACGMYWNNIKINHIKGQTKIVNTSDGYNCVPLRKCLFICMDCCLGPICESCGLVLSKIKITKNRIMRRLIWVYAAEFEDILGEPEGVRSIGCVWSLSFKCFNLCRDICYKLVTLFTGICMAIHLSHVMACVAYEHVWFITPCLKICEINCVPLRKCLFICVDCCLGPICESCGLMLSKIKITKN